MPHTRIFFVLALLIAALSLLVACGDDDDDAAFDGTKFAGTYVGTWSNSATGATGPVTIVITLAEDTNDASLTIDFDGNYLGLGDPPAATLEGSWDGDGAVAKGKSDLFGDYDVTIDPEGKITGIMQNVGGGTVPMLNYTGQLTEDRLDADYIVTLKDASTVNSTLRMTKQK